MEREMKWNANHREKILNDFLELRKLLVYKKKGTITIFTKF